MSSVIKKLIQDSLDKGQTQHGLASQIKISQSTVVKVASVCTFLHVVYNLLFNSASASSRVFVL